MATERRIDGEGQELLFVEPGIEAPQVVEAAREKAGAKEQQEREGDLGDDESLAEADVPAPDDAAGFVLQGGGDGGP
jgi:hypothetical protein